MSIIRIYSDGACSGNPGPGGWGAIIISDGNRVELSGGEKATTNNRMELCAVIEALKTLETGQELVVTTDSEYVKKGITEWIHGWLRNNWMTASKTPVKNRELWKELLALTKQHRVKWEWVRGHSGHPENERCDELARREISRLR